MKPSGPAQPAATTWLCPRRPGGVRAGVAVYGQTREAKLSNHSIQHDQWRRLQQQQQQQQQGRSGSDGPDATGDETTADYILKSQRRGPPRPRRRLGDYLKDTGVVARMVIMRRAHVFGDPPVHRHMIMQQCQTSIITEGVFTRARIRLDSFEYMAGPVGSPGGMKKKRRGVDKGVG